MRDWLKISHRRHSGRLRPHEYTSYGPLFVMLLLVGFALTVCTVIAATPYNGPESGYVALSGTMPGPPPKSGAVIKSPVNGQSFSTSPVTVAGSCPTDTMVEVFKNGIFAGSGPCKSDNTFSFDIDLLNGANKLTAKAYDALNQPGPDTPAVNVTYNHSLATTAGIAPLDLDGAQLLLNSDAVYRGAFPNQPLSIPISIIGGTPPYAINIQWGDGSNTVVSRANNLTFNTSHTYKKAGTFQITIQATDHQSRVAFLTVAAIVNGQPPLAAGSTNTPTKAAMNKLLVLWPLYTTAAAVVISFWMGERREKKILTPGLQFHPQL